jgi:ferredoxin hydrogenase large subunit
VGVVVSEVTKIKRKMMIEVATLARQNRLLTEIDFLPKKLTKEGFTNYRCCEYKERAVLSERIKLLLGVNLAEHKEQRLSEVLRDVLDNPPTAEKNPPKLINVIEESCDRCPIEKIVVTDACRNCVAHHCLNSCPKKAIEFVGNRAYINKERCVECGICAKSCHFGAILELERPCSRACAVAAIEPGDNCTAQINHERCVECGACIAACPFGSISERSDFLKVIRLLQSGNPVAALVAPSFPGQFGSLVDWEMLQAGLVKLGFTEVVSVADGAEAVAEEESVEVCQRLNSGDGYILNSCCPSFKRLVQLEYPALFDHVSATESPMLKTAAMVRKGKDSTNLKCVFIGPCIAKQGEAAREGRGIIEGVLTFEELAAMLVAANINLAETNPQSIHAVSLSALGMGFCSSGGVGNAVKKVVARHGTYPGQELRVVSAAGIANCTQLLKLAAHNLLEAEFVEGMGCVGGCIGGPGTLVEAKTASRALSKFVDGSAEQASNRLLKD